MLREAYEYLTDLTAYARVFSHQRALRKTGQGVDHRNDEVSRDGLKSVADLHPERMRLRVIDILEEGSTTTTLRFNRIDDALPPFRAGQYVSVFVDVDDVRTSRPYSISSAPTAGYLDLTIKAKPGGLVSPYLVTRVSVGDELTTTGVAGSFCYEPLIHGRDLVLIAAGSGITPFMSMLRSMAREPNPPRTRLIYGSRHDDDIIFGVELEELAATRSWLDVSFVISDPSPGWEGYKGRIGPELIAQAVGDVEGEMFYVCGPNGLYSTMEAALTSMGVETHRLVREKFGPPEDVTLEPMWPAEVEKTDRFRVDVEGLGEIAARADESLLTSLERNNVSLPTMCRNGTCSACRVKVLDGSTFTLAGAAIREADRNDGFTHACVTYPVGNLSMRT